MLTTPITTPPPESVEAAESAGLRYVDPHGPGYTRRRRGAKSFAYFDPQGRPVRDPAKLKRFAALVIPPAWEDVWICPQANGHLQVTGRDARGRKQYRYHEEWNQARNQNKFSRMRLFAQKLPLIRARLQRDLRAPGMGREKVLASVVRLMEKTLIRIGNDEYARSNKSFGLTTIRNHHVRVRGGKILMKFNGKSGQFHDVELEDPSLAPIVRRCQELPGQELFAYLNEKGQAVDVTSQDVNQYLHEISGENITAKDFRTWGGTVEAAQFLKDRETPRSARELKRALVDAVSHTSSRLRNTRAVCRKYYIHPCVFEAFENGDLLKIHSSCRRTQSRRVRGLYAEEKFALALLKKAVHP